MSPDNEANQDKKVERRKSPDQIGNVGLPPPDVPLGISEWQPQGDIDGTEVAFRGSLKTKHRRKEDPKPPNPHEII